MELKTEQRGKYLMVSAAGRLDASWSEYFADVFLNYIRSGNHHLIVDAGAMDFLSSAGIRSLIRIHKELHLVNGSFAIVNAAAFVQKTLEATGFGIWLKDSLPDDMLPAAGQGDPENSFVTERFLLNEKGQMRIWTVSAWKGWEAVESSEARLIAFPENRFSLGVGSSSVSGETARDRFGEFIAVCGNVAYQAPEERGRPDYLLGVNEFIPEMLVIQAMVCEGEMARLFRFAPPNGQEEIPFSALAGEILSMCGSPAAFVLMAETGGLVGSNLICSPAKISQAIPDSIAVRNWLSFCGERVFTGEQTLIFGCVAEAAMQADFPQLKVLPSSAAIAARAHAAVFPYQPLPNGNIDLKSQTEKFFSGPPPMALMRLIDDNRPVQGLGESTFIRGACWCAPLTKNTEGLQR